MRRVQEDKRHTSEKYSVFRRAGDLLQQRETKLLDAFLVIEEAASSPGDCGLLLPYMHLTACRRFSAMPMGVTEALSMIDHKDRLKSRLEMVTNGARVHSSSISWWRRTL